MKKVVEINNLTKYYNKFRAVHDLSLDVYKGEILGLLGPNGSGKSTTLNCLLSLLNYNEGSIKIFDTEMTPDAYEVKKKIGVVFQDVCVFDELTVIDNIDYFCGLYIKDKKTREKFVEDALKLVGLKDFTKFYPKQLSGGLLRRLNIACGIAHKPSLVILDEPTVAVDPQSRNNILEGIMELQKNGATVIYTTHYMEEAEQICSRIVIIDKGEVIAEGTKEELKELVDIEEKITIESDKISNKNIKDVKEFKYVKDVTYNGAELQVYYEKGKNNLTKLVDYLKDNEIVYKRVYSELPTLNDVFLTLTGKDLRD